MRIVNLNPDTGIGASAWFVDIEGNKILLDAGSHPKRDGLEALPLYSLIAKEELDAIAITHCHHDHVGSLPVAARHFPKAHVLMTELSYFIIERVLHNSVNVMARQRDELGIKEYPLYTHNEVDEIAALFQGFKYNREVEWASFQKSRAGFLSPTLEFYDAGHALGSAGVMLRGDKQSVFYTGDVCFHDQTLLRSARFEDVKADVLILETTRGDRQIPEGFTRAAEADRLAAAIQRVLERKGSVLLPTFALGRTQEILAQLAILMSEGKLQRQPIYIGGLGRVFTEIYDLQAHRSYRQHINLKLTEALNLIVPERGQTEQMRLGGGRLFVITAGMMTEKTPAHELALRMVEDERMAIFFVGYADPSTPGGRLKAAKPGEKFFFSPSGGELTKKCEVQDFDLTAHANRDELLDFVGRVSPHTVLLGHGEEASRQWFEQQIKARWPKMKVIQPTPGLSVEV
ncbi:MAG: MBL fold metallo-hydrolase [Verrucomicrobia bacterium]|nr:MBL fold metallo-hydrolase [Verrucomicrobiota bacterium]